ncbi:hypothetical protein D4764_0275530, partial [Takifugu flavidus]
MPDTLLHGSLVTFFSERPTNEQRQEEPIGWGSSQPQGWGSDQAQSTADQPHQGFERKQPSELTRTQQQHCADPLYQQHDDTSEFSNNFQQQQWYTLNRRSVGIEDKMSEPMDTGDIERPAKSPRLEEPIGGGSSQPQGWGNDQAQGTADQPHQGIEESRTKQQQWSCNQKRRWRKKHQAQANTGQPPLDSWMQNAGQ